MKISLKLYFRLYCSVEKSFTVGGVGLFAVVDLSLVVTGESRGLSPETFK